MCVYNNFIHLLHIPLHRYMAHLITFLTIALLIVDTLCIKPYNVSLNRVEVINYIQYVHMTSASTPITT